MYKRFIIDTPADCQVAEVNWRDNPWFNEVLNKERLEDKAKRPKDYDNVWEGKCKPAIEGAIYFDEVSTMEREKRIRNVPYDPMLKAHVVVDIGFNDAMVMSVVQRLGSEIRIPWSIEDTQRTYADYSAELKELRWNWGKVWLPHADGFSKDAKTGKGADQIMRALGWEVARKNEVSSVSVEEGIKIVRLALPRMYIDGTNAGNLVESLKRYRRHINKQTLEAGAPMHDAFCHGADNVRYIATNVDNMTNEIGGFIMPAAESYDSLDPAVM